MTHTSARRSANVQHFAFQSATCKIDRSTSCVAWVTFSGVVTSRGMDQFHQKVNAAAQGAKVMVVDLSRALFAMDILDLETSEERFTQRMAIISVPEEHQGQALAYASKMARLGLFRDIYLPEDSTQVSQFVKTLTTVRSLEEFVLGLRAQVR